MADESWDRKTERREYCSAHCALSETARKSVPRWVFIVSVGTVTSLLVFFIGWMTQDLGKFKLEMSSTLDTSLGKMERQFNSQIAISRELYTRDVERFYRAAENNERLLDLIRVGQNGIKIRLQEFKTKQDLVIKRIDLGNGRGVSK